MLSCRPDCVISRVALRAWAHGDYWGLLGLSGSLTGGFETGCGGGEVTSKCLHRDYAIASGGEPGNSSISCQHSARCNQWHINQEKCCPWQDLWKKCAKLSSALPHGGQQSCLGQSGGAGERNREKGPEMAAGGSPPISCSKAWASAASRRSFLGKTCIQ